MDLRKPTSLVGRTTARTAWPSARSCSARWLPRRPVAPVMTWVAISGSTSRNRAEAVGFHWPEDQSTNPSRRSVMRKLFILILAVGFGLGASGAFADDPPPDGKKPAKGKKGALAGDMEEVFKK